MKNIAFPAVVLIHTFFFFTQHIMYDHARWNMFFIWREDFLCSGFTSNVDINSSVHGIFKLIKANESDWKLLVLPVVVMILFCLVPSITFLKRLKAGTVPVAS